MSELWDDVAEAVAWLFAITPTVKGDGYKGKPGQPTGFPKQEGIRIKLATYDAPYTNPPQAVKDFGLFVCTNGKRYRLPGCPDDDEREKCDDFQYRHADWVKQGGNRKSFARWIRATYTKKETPEQAFALGDIGSLEPGLLYPNTYPEPGGEFRICGGSSAIGATIFWHYGTDYPVFLDTSSSNDWMIAKLVSRHLKTINPAAITYCNYSGVPWSTAGKIAKACGYCDGAVIQSVLVGTKDEARGWEKMQAWVDQSPPAFQLGLEIQWNDMPTDKELAAAIEKCLAWPNERVFPIFRAKGTDGNYRDISPTVVAMVVKEG